MPPEARLVKRIQSYLEGRGARPFKIVGDEYGVQETGVPDLLVCYRGRFVGLEVKQPGAEKNVSPRQKHVIRQITQAGGVAAVVSSVGAVEHLLEKIDRTR